jgi:uncharacterized membrane protein YcaP (DUF421 family)
MTGHLWFNGWASLGRIILFAVAAYVLLIALVRLFGNRTISKRNPSDFVITVAVGSVVANWLLQSPASFSDGVAAILVILGLQVGTEWLTTRSESIRKLTEGAPVLLAYRGELLRENMRHEHVNEHEVLASVRQEGLASLDDAEAVVLEIDGQFSVVHRSQRADALRDIQAKA